jgi:acetoin utilization protein AcuB
VIVQQVMSSEVRTLRPESSVRLAMKVIVLEDIRHLPIVEGGRLVGIVSARDLRAALAGILEHRECPDEVERRWSQPISNLMRTEVLAVHPEAELVEAIDLMIAHRIGALPVVEAGTFRLVGILSYVDILNELRNLLSVGSLQGA